MRVDIHGVQQGKIKIKIMKLNRIGETIRVMYGADAEVTGEVIGLEHYINQHANDHSVILTIRPII